MKRTNFSFTLSLIALSSVTLLTTVANAGPVRVSDVRQVVNSNPSKQISGSAAQLVVAPQAPPVSPTGDGQNNSNGTPQPQDTPPRVVTEEEFEVSEDTEPCNCPEIPASVKSFTRARGGFPWWLGFGAVPLGFIGCCGDEEEPPTSPTPTGSTTPTPPPEVPEPTTILLFGTGLTGIGFAARRWMRRRDEENES